MKNTIIGATPVTQSQIHRILSDLGSEEGQVTRRRNYLSVTRATTYNMFFSGHEYTAHEIDAWRNGVYYPIYDGEQQVAMIHKDTKVHGNLDEYELYTLDQKVMLAAAIYTTYLNILKYRNIGEFNKHKVQIKYTVSLGERTKAFLDRNFIDRCRLWEGNIEKVFAQDGLQRFTCKKCGRRESFNVYHRRKAPQYLRNVYTECLKKAELQHQTARERITDMDYYF